MSDPSDPASPAPAPAPAPAAPAPAAPAPAPAAPAPAPAAPAADVIGTEVEASIQRLTDAIDATSAKLEGLVTDEPLLPGVSTPQPNEPRPKVTPKMRYAAAYEIAQQLFAEGVIDAKSPEEIASHAEDIAGVACEWHDGYEIGKALDNRGWGVSFRITEVLDGFADQVNAMLERAERDWATRNDIQPPHPVGTPVKLKSGEFGVIDGIYKYGAAKYTVRVDDDPPTARRIIKFEDAVPHDAPAKAEPQDSHDGGADVRHT